MQDEEIFNIEKDKSVDADDKSDGEEKKRRPIVKTAMDLQRLKLEKLMKNPAKPIIIPETPKEKDYLQAVPSFVRNVMGSSAGAGSGEFHVYRHLRRKEYARQKYIQVKSTREKLDDEYRDKLERNRLAAEAKTAKKRAKRLKKKQNIKQRGKKPKLNMNKDGVSEEDDNSETEEDQASDKEEADEESTAVITESVISQEKEDAVAEEQKEGTAVLTELDVEKSDNPLISDTASNDFQPNPTEDLSLKQCSDTEDNQDAQSKPEES